MENGILKEGNIDDGHVDKGSTVVVEAVNRVHTTTVALSNEPNSKSAKDSASGLSLESSEESRSNDHTIDDSRFFDTGDDDDG
jgi:hypothetical protein